MPDPNSPPILDERFKTPIGAVIDYFGWTPEMVREKLSSAKLSIGGSNPFAPKEDPAGQEKAKKIVSALLGMIPFDFSPKDMAAGMLFGGPKAKGFGAATGKFSNLMDKKTRFEISDEPMKMKPNYQELAGVPRKLSDYIDHPELFKNYPGLDKTPVFVSVDPSHKSGVGSYSAGNYVRGIDVKAPSVASAEDTLIHEIQHAIQEKEGFARGGNPDQFMSRELVDKFHSLWDRFEKKPYSLSPEEYREMNNLRSSVESMGRRQYMRLAGEIEARDAAFRRLYTPYERRTIPPYSSQNIPINEAIVKFGGQ
jgi:hypothetical protein